MKEGKLVFWAIRIQTQIKFSFCLVGAADAGGQEILQEKGSQKTVKGSNGGDGEGHRGFERESVGQTSAFRFRFQTGFSAYVSVFPVQITTGQSPNTPAPFSGLILLLPLP